MTLFERVTTAANLMEYILQHDQTFKSIKYQTIFEKGTKYEKCIIVICENLIGSCPIHIQACFYDKSRRAKTCQKCSNYVHYLIIYQRQIISLIEWSKNDLLIMFSGNLTWSFSRSWHALLISLDSVRDPSISATPPRSSSAILNAPPEPKPLCQPRSNLAKWSKCAQAQDPAQSPTYQHTKLQRYIKFTISLPT